MKVQMDKIEKKSEKYYRICRELRKDCIQYLEDVLKANGNEITWEVSDLPEYVAVTYDGGNHPEYASNAFSTVHGIRRYDTGEITLDTEDTTYYSIDNVVSIDELLSLCHFLDSYQEELNIKI